MSELIFLIETADEGGYNARALGYSIFTQGETMEELKRNIAEAVKCHWHIIRCRQSPSKR